MSETSDTTGIGQLTVEDTRSDGVSVITVSGEIDNDSGAPLIRALAAASEASPPRVVVDLSQVGFMDSSGINIFLTAHAATTSVGGWLRLAALRNNVLRTLQIVGVDSLIPRYPSVGEALGAGESLGRPGAGEH